MGVAEVTSFRHGLAFNVQNTATGAQGRMQIDDAMRNPFGTVHAGALVWFADVVATRAAANGEVIGPQGQGFPLAVTLSAQLLANRREGVLHASATIIRRGRRITVIRTEVRDEAGELLLDFTSTHTPAS